MATMNRTLTLLTSSVAAAIAVTAALLLFFPTLHSSAAAACMNIDDTILSCKSQGMDYQFNTRPDGCKIATCISPKTCPDFALEIRNCRIGGFDYKDFWDERQCHRARCLAPPVTTEPGQCPMAWDEAKRKIANCESGTGFKAIVKETPTCLVFLDCQRVEKPVVAGEVACRKRVENGCTMIKCDDNFTWNSCASGQTSSAASSSGATTWDGCQEIQLKAKDADIALSLDKRNRTKLNTLNNLKVQLKQCRLKAAKP